MVTKLVPQLLTCPEVRQIVLTLNTPEVIAFPQDNRLLEVANREPLGFAANHNAAYQRCTQPYFCPLNPDIHLQGNPFPELLAAMMETDAAIVAPLVTDSQGIFEDSVRRFPTLTSLLLKVCGVADGRYPVANNQESFYADWVAGMFLLFRSADFKRLQGFDEKFFLYYEDVDICARAWKADLRVVACPSVTVIHDAQRTSHHSIRYLRWHLASMLRFFFKHWGRLPRLPEQV
jgi:GT2 family glycosyltransferase